MVSDAKQPDPQTVASKFTSAFYKLLRTDFSQIIRFYSEESQFSVGTSSDLKTSVAGLDKIKEQVESLRIFSNGTVDLSNGSIDSQLTEGKILVTVSGSLIVESSYDNKEYKFVHTFVLKSVVKEGSKIKTYFVLNSMFRFLHTEGKAMSQHALSTVENDGTNKSADVSSSVPVVPPPTPQTVETPVVEVEEPVVSVVAEPPVVQVEETTTTTVPAPVVVVEPTPPVVQVEPSNTVVEEVPAPVSMEATTVETVEEELQQENLEPVENEPKVPFSYAMMAAKQPKVLAPKPVTKTSPVSPNGSPEKKKPLKETATETPSMNGGSKSNGNHSNNKKQEIFSIYVTTKDIDSSVPREQLKDALRSLLSCHGDIGHITIGKTNSFAFVDFLLKEGQEKALASGSIQYEGMELLVQEKKTSERSINNNNNNNNNNNGGGFNNAKGRGNRNKEGRGNNNGENKKKENRGGKGGENKDNRAERKQRQRPQREN